MILKVLDYRKGKEQSCEFEEWNYFDNIVSASNYYDEEVRMAVVRCRFLDGSTVTISIPNVAYLMSDSGKTIDRIAGADDTNVSVGEEPIYDDLQAAVAAAMAD